MTTISLKLPVKTSSLRDFPKLPPGGSFYDKARPILKKAWMRRGRGVRDLATNPKYMAGFGK